MVAAVQSLTHRLIHDERGIQHAEEALVLALIAVASIGILGTLGNDINATFTRAGVELNQAATP